jgi:hypothetical protein
LSAINKLIEILNKLRLSLYFWLLILKLEVTTTLFSLLKSKKLNLNFNNFLFTYLLLLGANEIKGQTVVYSQGFETTNDWILSPSTFTTGRNYWVWETGTPLASTGTATHSGTKSLQILQKNSTNWNPNYSNYDTSGYTRIAQKSFDFSSIPCGSILIMKYWVLCNGETRYDDLTVSVNSNLIQGPISEVTSWQQKTIDLSSYVGNNSVAISFNWRNNASTSNNPPARIDDITISYNTFLTANSGSDTTICSGNSSQLSGTSTALAIGTTTTQSKIMTVEVLDSDETVTSITLSGAPNNAIITSLTFTPRVWVWDGSTYFVSCDNYNSWVKMQYLNGVNWIDIANCNQPITLSNFNGNLVNGTIIKIRTVNHPDDTSGVDDYVLTDILNVEANYSIPSPVTYSWSPTSGLSSSSIYNPIASPTTTTTYTMTATARGCSVSDDVKVSISPLNTTSSTSSSPILCINSALTNVTHTTTGATGIGTISNLPSGVSAEWTSNQIIISGTPTISGTFPYSIPLTGGCGNVNATGTIKVNPKPLTSSIYHE